MKKLGVSGYNKWKRTPNHKTKWGVVLAKQNGKVKTVRFGQQGVRTNQTRGQLKAFRARHKPEKVTDKFSALYWANKARWDPSKTKSKSETWKKG